MSVKQRLIEALELELAHREQLLYELKNRGSGPLPPHLRREAQARGFGRALRGEELRRGG